MFIRKFNRVLVVALVVGLAVGASWAGVGLFRGPGAVAQRLGGGPGGPKARGPKKGGKRPAAFVPADLSQLFDPAPRAVTSPAGTLLATGHWDGTLKLIDATTGKQLTLQKGIGRRDAEISAQIWLPTIRFSPDGKKLASHRANERVRVWDVPKRKQVATFLGHGSLLSFSSDGKLLAGHDGRGTVWIWDLATKKQRAVVETKEPVTEMNFSANGKMLVTTSAPIEGKVGVTVWKIQTGKARLSASGVSAQVVAGGKTLLVLTKGGRLTLWDLDTGKKRAMLDLYTPDK
jgi:WD40 repeat protein